MPKATTLRQREKKRNRSNTSRHQSSKEVTGTSSSGNKINGKLTFPNLWKYSTCSLLMIISSGLLFSFKENISSFLHVQLEGYSGLRHSNIPKNVSFPCRLSDEFSIDRRSNLSLEEFIHCYDAKRPVLITDVVVNWKAMNWTKSFFVNNYGDKRVSMKGTQGLLNQAKGFAVPLKMFAQHVHEGKPELWSYLEDELFIEMNPELRKHLGEPIYLKEDFFQLLPKEIRPWNAMLLWGTAYSRSTLHIDPYNWTGTNAVLSGKKMWKLYPPGQDHLLYVENKKRCGFPLDCLKYNSPVDAFYPDFKQFPKFRQAQAISFTQEPGEILIIPTGWFHQAFNAQETMAVSSQVMNSQNYKLLLEEIFKAGEVYPKKLPRNFQSLSARQQVEAVVKIIPKSVIAKGKKVTEDVLEQLKWTGKGAPRQGQNAKNN